MIDMAYMDYMDPDVLCPINSLTHSLTPMICQINGALTFFRLLFYLVFS